MSLANLDRQYEGCNNCPRGTHMNPDGVCASLYSGSSTKPYDYTTATIDNAILVDETMQRPQSYIGFSAFASKPTTSCCRQQQ